MKGFDFDVFDDFMRRMFGVCARCGIKERDLRPWPPDSTKDVRGYCGTCRCRMAVEGVK